MKIKELRLKNDAELKTELAAMREKIRDLRFKRFSQEIKNIKESAAIKKDIARIETILKERVLSAK